MPMNIESLADHRPDPFVLQAVLAAKEQLNQEKQGMILSVDDESSADRMDAGAETEAWDLEEIEESYQYLDYVLEDIEKKLADAKNPKDQLDIFMDALHTILVDVEIYGVSEKNYETALHGIETIISAYIQQTQEHESIHAPSASDWLSQTTAYALLIEESRDALSAMVQAYQRKTNASTFFPTLYEFAHYRYAKKNPELDWEGKLDDEQIGGIAHETEIILGELFEPYAHILPYKASLEMAYFIADAAARMPMNKFHVPRTAGYRSLVATNTISGATNDNTKAENTAADINPRFTRDIYDPKVMEHVSEELLPLFKTYPGAADNLHEQLAMMLAYEANKELAGPASSSLGHAGR